MTIQSITVMGKDGFRAEVAREFAVAKMEYKTKHVIAEAARIRYEQACAFLTYMENIEYVVTERES